MPLPLEFVVDGPPVSQQTRKRGRLSGWKRDVRNVAGQHWSGEPPVQGKVMVGITYFFTGQSPDVDNIPKPILDALNTLVYTDDSQVFDLLSRKRYIYRIKRVKNPTLLGPLQGSKPFLHIFVTRAPSQEVAC